MKTWTSFCRLLVVIILIGAIPNVILASGISRVTNVSPSPLLTNKFYITATNVTISINGTNVRALVYKDTPPSGGGVAAGIPGPLIEVNVGQTIICHFRNSLT